MGETEYQTEVKEVNNICDGMDTNQMLLASHILKLKGGMGDLKKTSFGKRKALTRGSENVGGNISVVLNWLEKDGKIVLILERSQFL